MGGGLLPPPPGPKAGGFQAPPESPQTAPATQTSAGECYVFITLRHSLFLKL